MDNFLRQSFILWCVVVTALLLISCSDSQDEAAPKPSNAPFEPVPISADSLPGLLARASASQKLILQDRAITFAEYETAVFATVSCLRDGGVHVYSGPLPDRAASEEPILTERGVYVYVADPGLGDTGAKKAAAVEHCKRDFSEVVEEVWFAATLPSLDDLQKARNQIAACLREAGIEVGERPSSFELARLAYPPDGFPKPGFPVPPYKGCAEKAATEFNIPRFVS